jgi:hypothetical protein
MMDDAVLYWATAGSLVAPHLFRATTCKRRSRSDIRNFELRFIVKIYVLAVVQAYPHQEAPGIPTTRSSARPIHLTGRGQNIDCRFGRLVLFWHRPGHAAPQLKFMRDESSRFSRTLISCCNYQRNIAGFQARILRHSRTSFLGLVKRFAPPRTV